MYTHRRHLLSFLRMIILVVGSQDADVSSFISGPFSPDILTGRSRKSLCVDNEIQLCTAAILTSAAENMTGVNNQIDDSRIPFRWVCHTAVADGTCTVFLKCEHQHLCYMCVKTHKSIEDGI